MTKEDARLLFMDYLYGELEAEAEKELRSFIAKHADLQKEFEELTDTRAILSHLPVQSPAEQIVLMPPENATDTQTKWWQQLLSALIPQSAFARTSFGVFAAILMLVITASVTNFSISTGSDGFQIAFGKQPDVQTGFSPEQVQAIIEQVKKDNAVLVAQVVTEAQKHQSYQIQQSLTDFASYLEEQRNSDLDLLSTGIAGLQESTYKRFQQTDQVLGEIIQTVSYNK